MKTRNRIIGFSFCLILLVAMPFSPLAAQEASIDFSPDITLNLSGLVTTDENVARDDFANFFPIPVGAIPGNANVTAYHMLSNGDALLSFDITIELPGAVVARPQDIVRYDGVNFSIEFDGLAEGIPSGVGIDAVSALSDSVLQFSLDTAAALPSLVVSDADIIDFDGASFSLVLDGAVAGIPGHLDVDALHFSPENGTFYLSFDTGGEIDGRVFSDEDLVRYDPGSDIWSLAYDGSARSAEWVAGDLDAAFVNFLVGFILKDGFETL